MEKKQQANSVFRWIKEKINTVKTYSNTTERSGQSRRTQTQKDTHFDGSLSILGNQAHILRSLQ